MLLLQTLPQRQQAIRCSYNEEQEFSETSRSKLIQAARLRIIFLLTGSNAKTLLVVLSRTISLVLLLYFGSVALH